MVNSSRFGARVFASGSALLTCLIGWILIVGCSFGPADLSDDTDTTSGSLQTSTIAGNPGDETNALQGTQGGDAPPNAGQHEGACCFAADCEDGAADGC